MSAIGQARGRRAGREPLADRAVDLRVDDRFEVGAGSAIGEHDPRRAPRDRASHRREHRRRRTVRRPRASAGRPGADRIAREPIRVDRRHAEGREPRQAIRLPGRNPAGQRDAQHGSRRPARLRGDDRVLEQHRDRQRADAARHRRQRAGDFRDGRMHVADDDRAAAIEVAPAAASRLKQSRRDQGSIGDRADADVDDRRRPASRTPA